MHACSRRSERSAGPGFARAHALCCGLSRFCRSIDDPQRRFAMEWEESKHPRHPAGSPGSTGGEFAPKDPPKPGGQARDQDTPNDDGANDSQTGEPSDSAPPPDVLIVPGPLPRIQSEPLNPLPGTEQPDPNPVISEHAPQIPQSGPRTLDENNTARVPQPGAEFDSHMEIRPIEPGELPPPRSHSI